MITISCGYANRHPEAIEFDWQRYLINNEENTYAFADLLWLMDLNNSKIWIRAEGYDRYKSLFVKKFIEPHIREGGYVKESDPDYAYWPMPNGSKRAILYRIAKYDNRVFVKESIFK